MFLLALYRVMTNTVNKARLGISSVIRLKLYFIGTNLMNTHRGKKNKLWESQGKFVIIWL